MANTTKAILMTLSTFMIALTTISVSLTFLTMIFWISLFKRSSILTLKAFDKSFSCSGLGAVSSNYQLDIVCLVTPMISPSASCERFASFLNLKIFSPNIMLSSLVITISNFLFYLLAKAFGIVSKIFNIGKFKGIWTCFPSINECLKTLKGTSEDIPLNVILASLTC